jgi:hypothetical protein
MFIKVNDRLKLTRRAVQLDHGSSEVAVQPRSHLKPAGKIMSRVMSALFAASILALAIPTAASAGCYSCYTPPPQPCGTCYQQQVMPPQYRTVEETVMISPGRTIAHRTPAQYRTVMVPRTVMVAPEGVEYEQVAPEYATQQRVEMVSPGYSYYAPVRPRCGGCGY